MRQGMPNAGIAKTFDSARDINVSVVKIYDVAENLARVYCELTNMRITNFRIFGSLH